MNRRAGIVSMIALSSFLLCGADAPTQCKSNESFGPSAGEVVGVAVAVGAVIVVGTVVLVEVHKSHHAIKGCVTTGPDGLEVLNQSDKRIYALTGVPANVKVGDIVKVSGTKEKKQRSSAGNEDFVVAKMSRDYGPCKVSPAP
jgi:hypothetical protein